MKLLDRLKWYLPISRKEAIKMNKELGKHLLNFIDATEEGQTMIRNDLRMLFEQLGRIPVPIPPSKTKKKKETTPDEMFA